MNNYIGIDVAKATLQIFIPENTLEMQIKNTPSGLRVLLKKLKKAYKKNWDNCVFVYESTGSYSTTLELFCQKKAIRCFKVGAYQSASFAKTIKNRNKTDIADARMLSQMHVLATAKDIKVPHRDKDAHKMRSFIKYYQSLSKEKTRLKNYYEGASHNKEDDFILRKIQRKIKNLSEDQKEIIQKVMAIIEANESYLHAYNHIISIKGIAQQSGIVLLYFFLRYPEASRQKITALSGLDPIKKESGTSLQKRARISKQGLSLVRGVLYMPVLSMVRHNNEMKTFYERLLAKGKPKRLAQIAVMRKVILLAYSLFKKQQDYDDSRYLKYKETRKVAT